MPRIFRYLLTECLLLTLAAWAVLTFLVMLPQVLRLTDFWVNKGASGALLGQLILLTMPRVLLASLPVALLSGILISLGRMSQESELVIFKACGIGLFTLARPIALLVAGAALLSLWLGMGWAPSTYSAFTKVKESVQANAAMAFRPQEFWKPQRQLTIYVQGHDAASGQLAGVVIHDQRDPKEEVLITARQGQTHRDPQGKMVLLLKHGSRLALRDDDGNRLLHFDSLDMVLGFNDLKSNSGKQSVDHLTAGELDEAMEGGDPELARKARVEWHRRCSLAGATLILGFLAIPLGMHSHRSGSAYGFVVALLLLTIHFILLLMGGALAETARLHPLLAYWGPNLFMAGVTAYVFYMTAMERPITWAMRLADLLAELPRRMLRFGSPS